MLQQAGFTFELLLVLLSSQRLKNPIMPWVSSQNRTRAILIDSLNPVEIKKKLSTMYAIASPGGTIDHQLTPPPTP
jgi:hypothetical protein